MMPDEVARAVYGCAPDAVQEAMIAEFQHYTGLGYGEIRRRLAHSDTLFLGAWLQADPKTPDEVDDFYRRTPTNAYASAWYAGMSSHLGGLPAIKDVLRTAGVKTVLDFGGGGGEWSIFLSLSGFTVTYLDGAKTCEFARWRFARRTLPIEVVDFDAVLAGRAFDAVIAYDVMEHTPSAEATMEKLVRYMHPGTILYGNVPRCTQESQPFHLPSNEPFSQSFGNWLLDHGFAVIGSGGYRYDGAKVMNPTPKGRGLRGGDF